MHSRMKIFELNAKLYGSVSHDAKRWRISIGSPSSLTSNGDTLLSKLYKAYMDDKVAMD